MLTATEPEPEAGFDPSKPVALHVLTFLDEGAEVTVGCRDIDSYAVLPADGAALLQRLTEGVSAAEGAEWYHQTYGETVDMADFIDTLTELGFVREPGDLPDAEPEGPVRWHRLGRAVFSPVSGLLALAVLIWSIVEMVRVPGLAPRYNDIFFSKSFVLDGMVMAFGQIPLLLLHEAAHALAGRRLGLRSKLSVGRRLYYAVFLTTLNGLVSIERRKRYLPMLAGVITDVMVTAVLVLAADAVRENGQMTVAGKLLTGIAYFTLLRILWQFLFYLETDLYYITITVLGCVDLHKAARRIAYNRMARLFGRKTPRYDESQFHPRDRQVARWYSWLIIFGYTTSIGLLVLSAFPMVVLLGRVFGRFLHPAQATAAGLADSSGFLLLLLAQAGVLIWPSYQKRRAARAAQVASASS
jgi:hypothetical protein